MDTFALYALTAGIVVSAVGALILALPLVRFGFRVPRDESTEAPPGGSDLSPLGRVAALVCFALTAGLTIVAVTVHARTTASVPTAASERTTDLTPYVSELRGELERTGERHAAAVASLAALEGRLGEVERALEALPTPRAETARDAPADRADAERREARLADLERAASRWNEVERLRTRLAELERAASRWAEVEPLRARVAELERATSRWAEVEQLRARVTELERAPAPSAEVERLRARLAELERAVRVHAAASAASTSAGGQASAAKPSPAVVAVPTPPSSHRAAEPARRPGEGERLAEKPTVPPPPEALERFVNRMSDAVTRFGDRLRELTPHQ